ncbi:hypothetical protein [Glycomyces harbinensis]|uniref:Uncharacterized protein n=1 Tax=Glycomyces harbinensis TaxID=58114 RepID=A0A1G7ATD7_9ACTN|nr:hypothetical protein [Glycomyces harbinensis]SDE17992.1 hypothetical protein SAMN05216270_114137 [Glycomyces harbinensis]
MPRPVPGPAALASYIQTGDRDARVAYRRLPDDERLAYRDTVNRVYDLALAHHLGRHPSDDELEDLIEQVAARHPQYAGGVSRVLRSSAQGGPPGGIKPRQILTAQHLVIREIAKMHPGFRARAERTVEKASRTLVGAGAAEQERPAPQPEFTARDAESAAAVTLRLDGTLRALELMRGVERMGGKSIGTAVVRAWVAAEKQRWARAKELGLHDSFPQIGTGANAGGSYRCEAYSDSGLCRATVDRYGRLRTLTFMRTSLFGDEGRRGLEAEIREAIGEAQNDANAAW